MRHLHKLFKKLNLSEKRGVLIKEKFNSWSQCRFHFGFEIREKLNKINPDAVYHFNNQPFILFFDLSNSNNKHQKPEGQIFKEVWSWDKVPVIFIIKSDDIKIYNAFHYQKELDQLEKIKFSSEDEWSKRFSFWELQSGNTWKWLEENIYKKNIKKQRVNYNLFNNIKAARIHLSEKVDNPLNVEFANILILRLIFIRYLIDRDVIIDRKFINGNSISEKKYSFNLLIQNYNLLTEFFGYLKDRFNGNLFETDNDPFVSSDHLKYLSNFFAANLQKEQLFIPYFDIFDFSIIPVEMISGIYESVIDDTKRKENSAVYTPLFLVDYILQNTIDKHLTRSNSTDCKVLDPSVGSGIFLTQTYRRLVEKEIQLKGKVTDNRLKEIVEQNLFGIDKDLNALHVAAFSIYISILDFKDPKEIDNFQLPNLIGDNLIHNDFFNEEKDEDDLFWTKELCYHSYNEKFKKIEFSFILGNPPWGSKKDHFHLKFINSYNYPITDYQISQSFLVRTKDFSNINTKCGLIPSSGVLHKAEIFRNYFLNNFIIDEVIDLSPSRFIIFEAADAPALIIFFSYDFDKKAEPNVIRFLSAKPNIFLKYFNYIVFEKIDIKEIEKKYFLENSWMWKMALYGNMYDFQFIKRITENKISLNDKIDNNKSIFKGNGILKGNRKKYFPFLENLKIIETRSGINKYFTSIDIETPVLRKEDTFLEAGRSLNLFKGEHILLRRRTFKESDILISYAEKDCVIRNSAYTITSSTESKDLKILYGIFISKLFTYYQYLTSENWGVYYPELNLKEYLSFPYKDVENKERFIFIIENFINHYKSYYTQEIRSPEPPYCESLPEFIEINKIINDTYHINDIEMDMIDYVLDVSRYQFQEGKLAKILRSPMKVEFLNYAQVFFDHYGSFYNEGNQYFQIEIYKLNYFVAMKFMVVPEKPSKKDQIKFGTVESEEKLFRILSQQLSLYEVSNQIFIQKNVIGFEKDWFYLIKPNEYKSWHRAIAHYDIAEFDEMIMKAELEEIKKNG